MNSVLHRGQSKIWPLFFVQKILKKFLLNFFNGIGERNALNDGV